MKFWISSFFTAKVVMIFRSASCPWCGGGAHRQCPPGSPLSSATPTVPSAPHPRPHGTQHRHSNDLAAGAGELPAGGGHGGGSHQHCCCAARQDWGGRKGREAPSSPCPHLCPSIFNSFIPLPQPSSYSPPPVPHQLHPLSPPSLHPHPSIPIFPLHPHSSILPSSQLPPSLPHPPQALSGTRPGPTWSPIPGRPHRLQALPAPTKGERFRPRSAPPAEHAGKRSPPSRHAGMRPIAGRRTAWHAGKCSAAAGCAGICSIGCGWARGMPGSVVRPRGVLG